MYELQESNSGLSLVTGVSLALPHTRHGAEEALGEYVWKRMNGETEAKSMVELGFKPKAAQREGT